MMQSQFGFAFLVREHITSIGRCLRRNGTWQRFPVVCASLMLLILTGCLPGDSIDRAVQVIDSGIADILARSDSWQSVLQRIANDLPQDISQTIRSDAQNLATRSIAQAGIEFRCNVDFLAQRAVEALRNLKARLLGQAPAVLPPAFCQVAPAAINLNDAPGRWSSVTFHGYNLDHSDRNGNPLRVLLLNSDGSSSPLAENRIGRTTHYQVTVNLGNMGSTLRRVSKLVMSWNNSTTSLPQVVVIPWTPARRPETVNMGRTSFMPPHTNGDRDFDTGDNDPTTVILRAEFRQEASSLDNRVFMRARESKGDHTMVEGWSRWSRAYSAPSGWRIVSFRPNAGSSHRANVTVHGQQTYSRPAGEVVNRFHVWVDRNGDEAGTWTRMEVEWRPIEVIIEQTIPDWLR